MEVKMAQRGVNIGVNSLINYHIDTEIANYFLTVAMDACTWEISWLQAGVNSVSDGELIVILIPCLVLATMNDSH